MNISISLINGMILPEFYLDKENYDKFRILVVQSKNGNEKPVNIRIIENRKYTEFFSNAVCSIVASEDASKGNLMVKMKKDDQQIIFEITNPCKQNFSFTIPGLD